MTTFSPPVRVRPMIVIVRLETETVPTDAVVYPRAVSVSEGALQPAGTLSVSAPSTRPPVAAVYVNAIVVAFFLCRIVVLGVVRVPEPSAAVTCSVGEEARSVSAPGAFERSRTCQLWSAGLAGAVAPGPPPALEP